MVTDNKLPKVLFGERGDLKIVVEKLQNSLLVSPSRIKVYDAFTSSALCWQKLVWHLSSVIVRSMSKTESRLATLNYNKKKRLLCTAKVCLKQSDKGEIQSGSQYE